MTYLMEKTMMGRLLKLAKVVIIYDRYQLLKLKSVWEAARLEELKKLNTFHEESKLTNLFRIQVSDEVISWINEFKN